MVLSMKSISESGVAEDDYVEITIRFTGKVQKTNPEWGEPLLYVNYFSGPVFVYDEIRKL